MSSRSPQWPVGVTDRSSSGKRSNSLTGYERRSLSSASPQVLGDNLRQVPHGPQLQLLDGSLRLLERLGRFRDRQAGEEPHRLAVALLVRQTRDRVPQYLGGRGGEHVVVLTLGLPLV